MKKFNLIEATLTDYPVIENMWRYYVYDLSRCCGNLEGWESPTELSFKCDDLTGYFETPDSHVFLIKMGNEHAGFVFVKKLDVMPEIDWYMSEFFIISKFQRSGIGEVVAKEIFEKFHGEWAVGVLPENTIGLNFWRKMIKKFTHENYFEEYKTSEKLKTKEHPNPHPMIILRFNSN